MTGKALIMMPAFNEAQNIALALKEVRESYPNIDIVVINDGSTDSTAAIATAHEVKVVSLPFNCSLGSAEITGFMYAAQNNYEIIFRVDADGQHVPSEIGKLAQPIIDGQADMVIGSRQNYRFPLARKTGSLIFSLIVRLITGQRIPDCTSGFRAFNLAAVKFLSTNYADDYAEVDSIITLTQAGYKVADVPVAMRYRGGGNSYFSLWRSVEYMLKVTLNILIKSFRRK
ncbi:glycosyltransferase family 2 protein [Candidatus Margulisiibacteriota bacterium]